MYIPYVQYIIQLENLDLGVVNFDKITCSNSNLATDVTILHNMYIKQQAHQT